uniref:cAMP responsive element modulator n=1 Tax=Pipistrellus kuhlii TaxID=59472 RepID=A0A7J8AZ06_PIPKU|nr:cAMP responsive element modulator [Pipistrellus kuhlii]
MLFQDLECNHVTYNKLTSACLEAAKECRRRKKEYVKCLESRVAVLEVQNKKLIEELETLKDICSPKTD